MLIYLNIPRIFSPNVNNFLYCLILLSYFLGLLILSLFFLITMVLMSQLYFPLLFYWCHCSTLSDYCSSFIIFLSYIITVVLSNFSLFLLSFSCF